MMPDTGTQGQEPSTTEPVTPATTDPAGEAKTDPWDGIPDEWSWAKNAVESANREAAARRVALREAEEKLKDAKTPEEFTAAMEQFKSSEEKLTTDLERERAARKHKLDDDLLEFLTGKTAEEIEAQAAKLAGLKPGGTPAPQTVIITQPEPAGGVTPGDNGPKEPSGRDLWREHKQRR
jgi:hypothetical protein